MRSGESFTGQPNAATLLTTTSTAFVLQGGKYWFAAVGTFNGGTASLQRLGPDGLTYLSVAAATSLQANGGGVAECPPGQYEVVIFNTTTALLYWELVRLNEE